MNLDELDAPFASEDIEWRIQQAGKNNNGIWAKVLAYVTNRAIMKRLDEVCGKAGWRNEYRDIPNNGGVECGISIKVEGEWITKWDAAENTQVEAVKGGRSGAMKRAAVQWGIGRYLYNLEEGFAVVSATRAPGFPMFQLIQRGQIYADQHGWPVIIHSCTSQIVRYWRQGRINTASIDRFNNDF